MFITKTKHEAALAERDATIAGLMRRLERAEADYVTLCASFARVTKRLIPFTTYTRGAGGRFVKR